VLARAQKIKLENQRASSDARFFATDALTTMAQATPYDESFGHDRPSLAGRVAAKPKPLSKHGKTKSAMPPVYR